MTLPLGEEASPARMRFSVVVPTYNRPDQLAGCLGALSRLLPPPGGFEIVIVNDGGGVLPVIASTACAPDARPFSVRVIQQTNAGPAAARNAGAAAALGQCVAFTDDDCLPDPGWLVALDLVLAATPDALIGGRTVNVVRTVYAEASQTLVDFVAGYFSGGVAGRFFASNNLAVARDAFIAAGAFDVKFPFSAGEDREFCDRWSAQGRPSIFVGDAVVWHAHPLSARTFARQHFTYGRGARMFRMRRASSGRPVRIDPGFYVRSIAHAFTCGRGWRAPAVALLTVGAHVAYVCGLVWESVRGRARMQEA